VVDVVPAEPAQRLDYGAADAAGRRHLARGGVLQDDLLPTQLHPARPAVGQESQPHGHLVRQAQQVGGVRPTCLQPCAVPPSQSQRDVVRGWRQVAKTGVTPPQVVDSTRELADGAGGHPD
jgi:hypothetical protein